MRKLKHIVEWAFVRSLIFIFGLMPYEKGKVWMAAVTGWLGMTFAGSLKRRMMSVLRTAFPEHSDERNLEIIRTTFENIGHQAMEFLTLEKMDQAWVDKYFDFEPTGAEAVRKAVREKKGQLFVLAHMGNWEMLNQPMTIHTGVHINLIIAPMSNPYGDKFLCNIRKSLGTTLIYPFDVGPNVLKALARGEAAAFASDQNAGRRGLFIPFLGQPASTHTGAAVFSYLSGAEIFFITNIRLPGGRFRIEILPMGSIDKSKVKDKEECIREFTLRYVDILEKYIRKYPDQYFWLHNRFKTKPLPEDEIIPRREFSLGPY